MHKKTLFIVGAVIALVAVWAVPGWCAFDCFLKLDNAQDLQAGSVNPKMVLTFTNLPVQSTGVSGTLLKHNRMGKVFNQSDILQSSADILQRIQGVQNVQVDKNAGTITLLLSNTLTHGQINELCRAIQQDLKPQGVNVTLQLPASWSWGEGQ